MEGTGGEVKIKQKWKQIFKFIFSRNGLIKQKGNSLLEGSDRQQTGGGVPHRHILNICTNPHYCYDNQQTYKKLPITIMGNHCLGQSLSCLDKTNIVLFK